MSATLDTSVIHWRNSKLISFLCLLCISKPVPESLSLTHSLCSLHSLTSLTHYLACLLTPSLTPSLTPLTTSILMILSKLTLRREDDDERRTRSSVRRHLLMLDFSYYNNNDNNNLFNITTLQNKLNYMVK